MSSNVYLSDFGKFYEVLNIFSRWIRAPIVTVNERVIEVCWNIEAVRGYKDIVMTLLKKIALKVFPANFIEIVEGGDMIIIRLRVI